MLDVETTRRRRTECLSKFNSACCRSVNPPGPFSSLEMFSGDPANASAGGNACWRSKNSPAMGKMAAGTAHHLNSPLAALLIRVQMMEQRAINGAVPEDLVRVPPGRVNFCRHFVGRLLEFTAPPRCRKSRRTWDWLSNRSRISSCRPSVRNGCLCSVDVSQIRGQFVLADRNLLETLLLALLSNALDAVPPEENPDYGKTPSSGRVEFMVRDNGCGIDAALTTDSEPFFTTKEPGKGTGLGLAIARNVVSEHGGTIRLGERTRKGNRRDVELPTAEGSDMALRVAK